MTDTVIGYQINANASGALGAFRALRDAISQSVQAARGLNGAVNPNAMLPGGMPQTPSQIAGMGGFELSQQFDAMQNAGARIAGFGQSIVRGVGGMFAAASQASIDFTSSLSEIEKVSGLSGDKLDALGQSMVGLSTTIIPSTAVELADIAAAGGRLGLAAEDLQQYVVQTSKMSTAFGITTEKTGDMMATIANGFGIFDAMSGRIDFARNDLFGNTVNNLADSMATSEASILEATRRMAGNAIYGINENASAAFAAGMTSVGMAPEVAARAMNSVVSKLANAPALGVDAQLAFKELGINVNELQQQFLRKDGTTAFMNFLKTVKEKGSAAGPLMTSIFGEGFQDEVLRSANGLDQFELAFRKVAESAAGKGSTLERSLDVMTNTGAAQLALLKNSVTALSMEIGNLLLPIIIPIAKGLRFVINGLTAFAQEHPRIAKIAVAFGLVAISIGAVIAILGTLLVLAGTVGVALTMLTAPTTIATMGAAIAGVTTVVSGLGATIMGVASGILGFLPGLLGGAAAGIASFGTLIMTTFAGIFTAIGGGLGGILTFFTGGWVTTAVNGLFGIQAAATGIADVIVTGGLSTAMSGITGGLGTIWGMVTGLAASVMTFATTVLAPLLLLAAAAWTVYYFWKPIKAFFAGLFEGIRAGLEPAWFIIKETFASVKKLFTEVAQSFGFLSNQYDGSTKGAEEFGKRLGTILGFIVGIPIYIADAFGKAAGTLAKFLGQLTGITDSVNQMGGIGGYISAVGETYQEADRLMGTEIANPIDAIGAAMLGMQAFWVQLSSGIGMWWQGISLHMNQAKFVLGQFFLYIGNVPQTWRVQAAMWAQDVGTNFNLFWLGVGYTIRGWWIQSVAIFSALWTLIKAYIGAIGYTIQGWWIQTASIFSALWSLIKAYIGAVISTIQTAGVNTLTAIRTTWSILGGWVEMLRGAIVERAAAVRSKILEMIQALQTAFSNTFNAIRTAISNLNPMRGIAGGGNASAVGNAMAISPNTTTPQTGATTSTVNSSMTSNAQNNSVNATINVNGAQNPKETAGAVLGELSNQVARAQGELLAN